MKGRNKYKNNPTARTYTSLTTAYDFFNEERFSGNLPACLITIQRHKGSLGVFSGERFANTADPGEITDEISLNPVHFATRKPVEVLSTLVHEMAHLWQHHFGERPRKGYHDRQWAGKMLAVGAVGRIPTETGEMGGKQTGQHVTHMIEEEGRFAHAVAKLLKEHPAILYHDRSSENDEVRKKKSASKTKYTCRGCGLNAWAKAEAPLICGGCQEAMQAEESMP